MVKKSLVPVSERALLARVNRQLIKQGQQLLRCPPNNVNAMRELGRFYVVNVNGGVECQHQDIEELAKELGVLRPYEKLAE